MTASKLGITLHKVNSCKLPEVNGQSLQRAESTDLVTVRTEQLSADQTEGDAQCVSRYLAMIENIIASGKLNEGTCVNTECPWNVNYDGQPVNRR